MLNKKSMKPLYKQLMDEMIHQIRSGVYQAGDKIPVEDELVNLYQVSKITVRRAVQELCEEHYLVKQQGKGTFVTNTKLLRKFEMNKNMGFTESCISNGKVPGSHVLSYTEVTAEKEMASFLDLAPDETIYLLERILSADQTPIIYDCIYLPARLFPDFNPMKIEDASFFQYIKDTYGYVCAEDSQSVVSAAIATADVAKKLHLSIGDPVLFMESFMCDSTEKALYVSRQYMAGDRYRITI